MTPTELIELKETNTRLLEKPFIGSSVSPWEAQVLLVRRKIEILHCMWITNNYKLTIKNKYPLWSINDSLDQLHGAVVFSNIGLRLGYH